jgi:LPS export ABC transporter protein LptC
MIKDPRNLLWITPLALLLTLPVWKPMVASFLSPERKADVKPVASLTNLRTQTSSEMNGIQFEQSSHGVREWLLTASRLHSSENESVMELEDVRAMFYGTGDKSDETRISSHRANYISGTRQLYLQGEVVVKNQQGYEMLTESLEYLPMQKKIQTLSPVRIKGENIKVSGRKLLYDITTGNYSIEGNVVCRVW